MVTPKTMFIVEGAINLMRKGYRVHILCTSSRLAGKFRDQMHDKVRDWAPSVAIFVDSDPCVVYVNTHYPIQPEPIYLIADNE